MLIFEREQVGINLKIGFILFLTPGSVDFKAKPYIYISRSKSSHAQSGQWIEKSLRISSFKKEPRTLMKLCAGKVSVAGPAGFEPATSGLEGRRPVLLGYGPVQWIEQNHAFKLCPTKFLWWASEKLQLSTVRIPRLRKFVSAAVLHLNPLKNADKGVSPWKGRKRTLSASALHRQSPHG